MEELRLMGYKKLGSMLMKAPLCLYFTLIVDRIKQLMRALFTCAPFCTLCGARVYTFTWARVQVFT